MSEKIKITQESPHWQGLYNIWLANGKPRELPTPKGRYRVTGTEEGVVFTPVSDDWESKYGSLSTGGGS